MLTDGSHQHRLLQKCAGPHRAVTQEEPQWRHARRLTSLTVHRLRLLLLQVEVGNGDEITRCLWKSTLVSTTCPLSLCHLADTIVFMCTTAYTHAVMQLFHFTSHVVVVKSKYGNTSRHIILLRAVFIFLQRESFGDGERVLVCKCLFTSSVLIDIHV